MSSSLFKTIRKYINYRGAGALVTRQELLKTKQRYVGREWLVHLADSTVDNYRRRLTILGYLETQAPGTYKVVKKIPAMVNSSS